MFPRNEDGTIKYDTEIHPTTTWLAMEKLVEKGLTKAIGLSNFNSEQVKDVLDKGTVKPVTNQVECHPYLGQAKLLAFCKERGITITAYSPLGKSLPHSSVGTVSLLRLPGQTLDQAWRRQSAGGPQAEGHCRQVQQDSGPGGAALAGPEGSHRHTQVCHSCQD